MKKTSYRNVILLSSDIVNVCMLRGNNMRKSYTYGIPFGLHRETGRYLDITEVSRGVHATVSAPGVVRI